MIRIVKEGTGSDKYIYIPNLWQQYGPVNNIKEFTLDKVIDSCKYDRANITGDTDCKYMTVLLLHTISGTRFRKLIFSDNLLTCKREAREWLNTDTHELSKNMYEAPTYYALIYNLYDDNVILWDRVEGEVIR